MDDDFDDPELWEAAERAATASASAQKRPQQPAPQSLDKRPPPRSTSSSSIVQPRPQLLDKRPPPRAPVSSDGGKVVQPTPQRLDKPPPPHAAASGEGKVVQPTPQALPQRSSGSSILVSPRQKGNPVLQCIKSVAWEYADIPADYGLGITTCALFLSLKYHRLYPEYVYGRIRNLQGKYNLRILLTMVDIENHEDPLRELVKMSFISNVTLILCWSAAEAARYLELYKSYEHAGFKAIQGRQGTSYAERLVDFVTVPRGVNKSDAVSLVSNFGSLKNAINAEPEQIGIISGWGGVKVERWCSAIEEPFRVKKAARRTIAEVTATSSALIDPRLDTKSSQVPSGESNHRPAATPRKGQASGPEGDEEDAMSAAAMEEAKKTSQQAWPTVEPSSKLTAAPRQAQMRNRGDEEEEAMLAAAIEESKKTSQQAPAASASSRKTAGEESLSGGVAAALAKLREQG
ncbi:hypothetical protein VUR80DRAFT_10028 [Thermomyces stellatus]